jgi:hypothetical protein
MTPPGSRRRHEGCRRGPRRHRGHGPRRGRHIEPGSRVRGRPRGPRARLVRTRRTPSARTSPGSRQRVKVLPCCGARADRRRRLHQAPHGCFRAASSGRQLMCAGATPHARRLTPNAPGAQPRDATRRSAGQSRGLRSRRYWLAFRTADRLAFRLSLFLGNRSLGSRNRQVDGSTIIVRSRLPIFMSGLQYNIQRVSSHSHAAVLEPALADQDSHSGRDLLDMKTHSSLTWFVNGYIRA